MMRSLEIKPKSHWWRRDYFKSYPEECKQEFKNLMLYVQNCLTISLVHELFGVKYKSCTFFFYTGIYLRIICNLELTSPSFSLVPGMVFLKDFNVEKRYSLTCYKQFSTNKILNILLISVDIT